MGLFSKSAPDPKTTAEVAVTGKPRRLELSDTDRDRLLNPSLGPYANLTPTERNALQRRT